MKNWIILFLFLLIGGVGGSKIRHVREGIKKYDSDSLPDNKDSLIRRKAYERASLRFPNDNRMRNYHAERILSAWGY